MATLKDALAHVLWIGGATDAGKSTVAQILATRHSLHLYNYDRYDLPHHQLLTRDSAKYQAQLSASLDESWVYPTPETLLERALQSFRDRFPFVVEDLLALPRAPIVVEGFGLMPDLLLPVLTSSHQAIWLVPTAGFKLDSMRRRNKPSFQYKTSAPERAFDNLYKRDMLLAELVRREASSYDLSLCEVDGSLSPDEIADRLERHFGSYMKLL